MKDFVVIGGGISGLVAAYRTTKAGFNTVLFEEGGTLGGRLKNCINLTNPKFNPKLYKLIKEFDIEGADSSFTPDLMGIVHGKDVFGCDIPGMLANLPPKEGEYMQKIMGEAMQSTFDPFNPSENLLRLREISFEDYLKDCPPALIEKMIKPMLVFTFLEDIDISKLSAEYCLFRIRFESEVINEKARTLEEGSVLSSLIEREASSSGMEACCFTEVEKVEKTECGFRVYYNHLGSRGEVDTKKVISSIPLNTAERVIPGLDIGKGVFYSSTKCIFLSGETKNDYRIYIGFPNNEANLRVLYLGEYEQHFLYPFYGEQPVDFSMIYNDYRVEREEWVREAFPSFSPGAKVPGVKTSIDGLYLCGDFFYYPSVETSIHAGEEAARIAMEE